MNRLVDLKTGYEDNQNERRPSFFYALQFALSHLHPDKEKVASARSMGQLMKLKKETRRCVPPDQWSLYFKSND